MRITYLIGNGFDLGLGIPTSYKQFLANCYLQIKNSGSQWADLLRDIICKNLDSWGDAELAFAKIDDKRFHREFPGSFYSAYDDFKSEMTRYLRRCEGCVVEKVDEDVSSRFRQTLLLIFTWLSKSERECVEFNAESAIELNFVNFNYTRTLSTLLGNRGYTTFSCNVAGREKLVLIHEPIHVHNTLNSDVVFGVCEKNEISGFGREGLDMEYLYQLLLKRDDEKASIKDHAVMRAWNVLAKSDVIVIFGMSLGASDSYWWKGISELLKRSIPLNVIYSPYFRLHNDRECCETLLRKERERIQKILEPKEGLHGRVLLLGVGPHYDFDGEWKFCDPLHLEWFSRRIVMRDRVSRLVVEKGREG